MGEGADGYNAFMRLAEAETSEWAMADLMSLGGQMSNALMRVAYLNKVLAGYIECALWSSVDWTDGDKPLDQDHDEIEPHLETLSDIMGFVVANLADLAGMEPGQVGHDFWLTRNHHGAGFWDRGLGERGIRLTEAAHVYGESSLYVGDDGKVYVE